MADHPLGLAVGLLVAKPGLLGDGIPRLLAGLDLWTTVRKFEEQNST